MRICFAIHSLQAGGMERVMSEIINNFAQREGLELHLLMYGMNPQLFYDVPDVVVIHKPEFAFDNERRMYSTLKTVLFIRREVKGIDPDRILSFGEVWNNLVMVALYGLKYPIFISDRCQPTKSFGKMHDYLRKRLYPKAKCVIAQTEKAKEVYKKQFRHNNIVVIGNPIRRVARRDNIVRENIVVSVGRLITTKNFDQLIEIFASIGRKDWKLVIVGGDALKQNNSALLSAKVAELGLTENVLLVGAQRDVDLFLQKSKIFAFTSSSEGFPNVIGEAMSAGLPIVAYDCVAGPSEMVVDGENGFLVPLFDRDCFRQRLSLLMDSEELRQSMGGCATKYVERFSTNQICDQYYRLFYEWQETINS